MYYDFAVKIPAEKGKIFTKDKGGASYVLFQYGTEYKADRKYAVPKRAIIGVSVGRFSPFRVGLKTPISVNLKSPMHHVCY